MDGSSTPDAPASGIAQSALHQSLIVDQFTRQAELFAASPALHNDAALALMVEAGAPLAHEETLDVACGPGSVVAAFARLARRSVGLDATAAMLQQARELLAAQGLKNAELHQGDVYRLPFAHGSYDIVTCRFAFHHFQAPEKALGEMVRVCRPGGRVVLCDGLASDDPARAAAFNRMERHRDPSTVEFRPLAFHLALLAGAGLTAPQTRFYRVPAERDRLIAMSFPTDDDRELLRRMIDESVEGDTMGVGARRKGDTVVFGYPAVVLVAAKPQFRCQQGEPR